MKKLQLLFLFGIIATSLSAQADLEKAKSFMSKQFARFEENKGQIQDLQGQAAPYVRYHYTQGDKHIFMLPTGIAYQFNRTHYPEGYKHLDKFAKPEEQEANDKLRKQIRLETYRMDMELVGANPNAKIIAEERSADYINYYNKNALDVHSFQKLTYQDIYPNIDWVIYSNEQGLKYDFVVHPGGNPAQIRLQFKNHENLKLNADGSFTLSNRMGTVSEEAPVSFQDKKAVPTRFVLEGDVISFDVANYNPNQTLVIDPNLLWATYYGGSGYDDFGTCVIDSIGNLYLAGRTSSMTDIATVGYQNVFGGNYDVFLVKFNSSGVRQWATYYGGNGAEYYGRCAVDNNSNVYLTGRTNSTTNIALSGHQNILGGSDDVFVVKFDSAGNRLWATYYGGTGAEDYGYCIADAIGNVYLSGRTNSNTGIAFSGYQMNRGGGIDAFLVKFDSSGTRLWATYYGGGGTDEGWFCNIDAMNRVYLGGRTSSGSDISFAGHQNILGGGQDAFLVKFDSSGPRLWATYYGGLQADFFFSSTIDTFCNIYVIGKTNSLSDIASGGYQNTLGGSNDAFLVKFDSSGARQWATYYGGPGDEEGVSCAVDFMGNLYMVGSTNSSTGISSGGYQDSLGGGIFDAFLVKFNNLGLLQWATYYGGPGVDVGTFCTVDFIGNVYLIGYTDSTLSIPLGGYQSNYAGGTDAFLVKFDSSLCSNTISILTNTACDSFSLDGQTYTNSGTYIQILTNTAGCDSTITLNLTITHPSSSVITQSACDSFILNGQNYTTSGTYTQTLTNTAGCDSIITLNLTINQPTTSTLNETACVNYTLNSQTYTSTGTYTQILTNSAGCDSTITLNLTITNIDSSLSINASTLTANETGASYQWLDCNNANQPIVGETGQSFTPQQSGNYAVQITKNGCTAISNCYQVQGTCAAFSINFTVAQIVPFEVSVQPYINGSQPTNNISLIWDFGDGTPLTAQNPASTLSHLYAGNGPYNLCMYVIDSTINCSAFLCDTLEVDSSGLLLRGSSGFSIGAQPVIFNGVVATENISASPEMNISLFPNPATNQTTVAVELGTASNIRIRLINSLGQVVQTTEYSEVLNVQHSLELSDLPAAIYLVEISANGFSKTQRLVILRK